MGKIYNNRAIFRTFLSFLSIVFFVSSVKAEQCISSYDEGTSYTFIIPAKPDLTTDNGYSHASLSQRSVWTDTNLYTNGDPFVIEITGMWTPYYGNYATSTDGTNTIIAPKSALCSLGIVNPQGGPGGNNTYDFYRSNLIKDTKNGEIKATTPLEILYPFYDGSGENYVKDNYLTTTNETLGINGEFDYIASAYSPMYDENEEKYTKEYFEARQQKACWLTAGEGLYIAFFGRNGTTLPDFATHLKSAVIACDKEYYTDKNNDGVITIDECYGYITDEDGEKKKKTENKAYYMNYRPSANMYGEVKCDPEYFHGTDSSKIGINDCYQENKDENGNVISKTDRTKFVFYANNLFKSIDDKNKKTRVGKNERVKFIIYDTYYSDNVGQYQINIYGGVSDLSDSGIVEKILTDLEEVFIGVRNEYGDLEGGILKQFYKFIIQDSSFIWTVRMFIILYMAFLGLQIAIGSLEFRRKELMNILLKLTFILGFTTITSWEVYDYFIVRFFVDGFSDIIVTIANITNRMFDPESTMAVSGSGLSSKFAFIDDLITYLFSDPITRKIQGLFFGVWFGFIVIPIIYILIIYYIWQLLNATFPYIIMFIQAIVALILGPVFISFYLFKPTEHLFKNWLAFVGAKFANMAFLFLFLFSFAVIIREQFKSLLNFEVCKVSLWNAVFSTESSIVKTVLNFFSAGIKVWDANWSAAPYNGQAPKFLDFCISLLFLFILIYLFGYIMKKVPDIVDSLVSIGNEKGGIKSSGDQPTLGEALESSLNAGDDKDHKTTDALRGLIKKPLGAIGGEIKKGLSALPNKIRDLKNSADIRKSVAESGLKGLAAIDKVEDTFKSQLRSGQLGTKTDKDNNKTYFNNYSASEIESRSQSIRDSMMKSMITDPFEKIISDSRKTLSKIGNVSPEEAQKYITSRIEDYALKNLVNDTKHPEKELQQYRDILNNMASYKAYGKTLEKNYHRSETDNDLQKIDSERQIKLAREAESLNMKSKDKLNLSKIQEEYAKLIAQKNKEFHEARNNNDRQRIERERKELLDRERKFREQQVKALARQVQALKKSQQDLSKDKQKAYELQQKQIRSNVDKEINRVSNLLNQKKQDAQLYNESIAKEKAKLQKELSSDARNRNILDKDGKSGNLSRIQRSKKESQLQKIENNIAKNNLEIKGLNDYLSKLESTRSIFEDYDRKFGENGKVDSSTEYAYFNALKDYSKLEEESNKFGIGSHLTDKEMIVGYDLQDLALEQRKISEDLEKTIKEINSIKDVNEFGQITEPKQQTFIMEGIDADTFGVQGITSLGFGEDEKDRFGLAVADASAVILGKEYFEQETKDDVHDPATMLLRTQLTMARSQQKALKYQIAIAENNNDNADKLKEELKQLESKIRIIEDDLEETTK